jgi:(p)ppGpp synthase/HD superfamily hydrolase
LHDILEDTPLSYNDVKKEFGEKVADIVYDVTDELGKNRKERKERTYPKIRANHDAILVKICDRIANANNSKKLNKRMFEMYKKEHRDFIVGITTGINFTPEILRGMKLLNNIINGQNML